jgi:hypothetical protein
MAEIAEPTVGYGKVWSDFMDHLNQTGVDFDEEDNWHYVWESFLAGYNSARNQLKGGT